MLPRQTYKKSALEHRHSYGNSSQKLWHMSAPRNCSLTTGIIRRLRTIILDILIRGKKSIMLIEKGMILFWRGWDWTIILIARQEPKFSKLKRSKSILRAKTKIRAISQSTLKRTMTKLRALVSRASSNLLKNLSKSYLSSTPQKTNSSTCLRFRKKRRKSEWRVLRIKMTRVRKMQRRFNTCSAILNSQRTKLMTCTTNRTWPQGLHQRTTLRDWKSSRGRLCVHRRKSRQKLMLWPLS